MAVTFAGLLGEKIEASEVDERPHASHMFG